MKTLINLSSILFLGILMIFSCTKDTVEVEEETVFRSSERGKPGGGGGKPGGGGNECTSINYELKTTINNGTPLDHCFENCEGESQYIVSTTSAPGNTFVQLNISAFVPCTYNSQDFDGKSLVITPDGGNTEVEYYFNVGDNGFRIIWYGTWEANTFTAQFYEVIKNGKSKLPDCLTDGAVYDSPISLTMTISDCPN